VRYSDTPPTLSNTVLFSTSYDPYGVPLFQEETLGTGQPFGYTGAVFDPDFQFHYLRARWYNPKSGRFLQRDSVRGALTTPTALYRYAYAHHNPLVYTDPTGHWAWPYWGLGQIFPLYEGGAGGLDWCAELAGVACGALPPPSIDDTGMLSVLVLTPFLGSLTGGAGTFGVPVTGRPGSFPPGSQAAVNEMGRQYYCHTCLAASPGTPHGNWVRDHWPPTQLLPYFPPGTQQVLLPQCASCMYQQAGNVTAFLAAMRAGNQTQAEVYWWRIFTPISQAWPRGPWPYGP
jgi:RHS repeat-associated protein